VTEGRGDGLEAIDELLPPRLREVLEERYWRPIEEAARLDALAKDASFLADPVDHQALYSDHGTVHARDIAASFVSLAATADGLLLARRPPERQAFLVACGLLLTYLHDVGMVDQTPVGRRLHPITAAHVAFGAGVDDVVAHLLAGDGPVAGRLREVEAESSFAAPPDVVLRELLSLSVAHSKSTVPAPMLDDRAGLQRLVRHVVFADLAAHRSGTVDVRAGGDPPLTANADRYTDPLGQSFAWLVSVEPAQARLADDVVDAVRVLRAADALRQRGTSLKTSAGYEIFVDAATGEAVYALRPPANDEVYLFRGSRPANAGEANVRMAAVTPTGHLRLAFHRGAFLRPEAARYATDCTAYVVGDIADDVLTSFTTGRPAAGLEPPRLPGSAMQVQLERPADNPAFAEEVGAAVAASHPELAHRVVVVADLEGVAPEERERYDRGVPVDPVSDEARHVLEQLALHGTKVDGIDVHAAFADVRMVRVGAGEVLAAIGSTSAFVYVATGPGLRVRPGGGYRAESVGPWVPVGTTGVIRRAERNAEVTAERDLDVLLIPGECYVRVWFRPYAADELADVLRKRL
jgi:hypothetical protein